MNFSKSKMTSIKGDASFRKFYRKKINKKSSIIVYAKKEKIKNLLNYDGKKFPLTGGSSIYPIFDFL
jgi:hypothetical protein